MKYAIMSPWGDGPTYWSEERQDWVGPFDKSKTLYDTHPMHAAGTEIVEWQLSTMLAWAVERARAQIGRDNELAAFLVRDYPELKLLGLTTLAGEMASPRVGYTSKQDVEFLLDKIEEAFA